MSLPDAKVKAIRDFISMMQKAQVEGRDAKDGNRMSSPAQMAAYSAMMVAGISPQDLAEFSAQFPETRIGTSGL